MIDDLSGDRDVPEAVGTLIVGSGVAATAVASEMLRWDPSASVLLLEAGPRIEMKNYRIWQDFKTTGQKPYDACLDEPYPERDGGPGANHSSGGTVMPLQGSRLMTYGGSTVHWGGWSFRLKPEDFFLHTNTGHGIDWPFDYDHLRPFYDAAEEFIGVSGEADGSPCPRDGHPYPFPAFPYTLEDSLAMEAMDRLAISYHHLPIARHGITRTDSPYAPCQTTGNCKYCPFGARFVAGNTLDVVRFDEAHSQLDVCIGLVAESLVMDGQRRVAGVHCFDRLSGRRVTIRAERVVIAAGAIESAKLLLRSVGDDWPDGVGNEHGLVGRYLITHPYFIFQADLASNSLGLTQEMDFPTLCSRHFDSPDQQKAGKFVLIVPPDGTTVDVAGMMKAGKTRDEIDAAITGPNQVHLHGMVEVFSEYGNHVANLPSRRNQFDMVETDVHYTASPSFQPRLEAILNDHIGPILGAMGGRDPKQQMLSWRADHAACITRMAASEQVGVVDPDLRVHGVDNLWIASNATFASLGAVNPTLTLTALSLRLGRHLAGIGSAAGQEQRVRTGAEP